LDGVIVHFFVACIVRYILPLLVVSPHLAH
jgi:hypothetical protein